MTLFVCSAFVVLDVLTGIVCVSGFVVPGVLTGIFGRVALLHLMVYLWFFEEWSGFVVTDGLPGHFVREFIFSVVDLLFRTV